MRAGACPRDSRVSPPGHRTVAREQITARALADGNNADDYATTLAVAILTGTEVAQIGGTIAVAGHAGSYQAVAPAPPPST